MKKFNILFALLTIYFSAFSQAPTIISFSPVSGPVGTLVTIIGTNLSNPTAFTIGGVSAIAVSNNDTTLVGMVMPGAVTSSVSITNTGGTVTSGSNYIVTPTLYPTTQLGNKLVGNGAIGQAGQGRAVAISADGSTAIVGGDGDNSDTGAVWIYTRIGNTWSQQGPKLVGTGGITAGVSQVIGQGAGVALSADGNTAIVGSPGDNNVVGATWIFTRSGGVWTQQGPKLVGTGYNTNYAHIYQGNAVAISADGNTALIGGHGDDDNTGAVWVFTRTGGIWSQQGTKLLAGLMYYTQFGCSVALSADGNTALIGGQADSLYRGAAWVFIRSGGVWTQQGPKLVGTGAVFGYGGVGAYQGNAVSLSADGNTAMIGGSNDSAIGAAWIFTRSGGIWTQQGNKLVGSIPNTNNGGVQRISVSLSADANTAILGRFFANGDTGAVSVFTHSGSAWSQQGPTLTGSGSVGYAWEGSSIGLSSDGRIAIVGGSQDDTSGAAWIFGLSCSVDSSHIADSIHANTLPYTWNGLTFTGSGSQTAHLTSIAGCDSLATLVLTVLPTGISEINAASSIHLYPNPNKGSFTLKTSASIGSDYTITDVLGHVIMQQPIRSDNEMIELPDAAEGVYILTVKGAQPIRFAVLR